MARRQVGVNVKISAKDDASKETKRVESSFKRLTNTVKSSAAAQVAALGASLLAIRGLVRGIKSVISAAAEQEAAEKALADARGASIDSLLKQASALQKVTTFGDEEIIRAQALIASFVKEDDAIKAATKSTADLAAAKGFNLVAAADLVSKTLGSSTNALSRYGIEVTGAVGSTERLTSLTGSIEKVFGGRARGEVETFAGSVRQVGNAWGDLEEKLGFALTKNDDVVKSLRQLTNILSESGEAAESLGGGVSLLIQIIAGIIEKVNELGTAIGHVAAFFDQLGSDEAEISLDALKNIADRLGISVEELTDRIDKNIKSRKELSASARESAEAEGDSAAAMGESAGAADKLSESLREAASAYEGAIYSASTFGEVTSVELETQILDINIALLKQKEILGENSLEYQRLSKIAGEKIDLLKSRIASLRDGLGDLKDETTDAIDPVDDLGIAIGETAEKTREAVTELRKIPKVLGDAKQAIITTSVAFDQLAESAGRASAIQAAIAGGAQVTQGGTRLRFQTGGSRLLHGDEGLFPGLSGTAGVFSVPAGTNYQVLPDGKVIYL